MSGSVCLGVCVWMCVCVFYLLLILWHFTDTHASLMTVFLWTCCHCDSVFKFLTGYSGDTHVQKEFACVCVCWSNCYTMTFQREGSSVQIACKLSIAEFYCQTLTSCPVMPFDPAWLPSFNKGGEVAQSSSVPFCILFLSTNHYMQLHQSISLSLAKRTLTC